MSSRLRIVALAVALSAVGAAGAHAQCLEASCNSVQGTYISHFTGPNCDGTEAYYRAYDGFAYNCRTWNGSGQCGTTDVSLVTRSWRMNNGDCKVNAWPSGNPLNTMRYVYRAGCGEASCISVQGTYISHFSGTNCNGAEYYYRPYDGYAYTCRTWNGSGECGTTDNSVTTYSWRMNNGECKVNAWPSGNPLHQLRRVYRGGSPPSPVPPVACGFTSTNFGTAPLSVWFYGSCSYDPDGGSITNYFWDFWDGVQWGSPGFHTFWSPGTYPVWLTVWDDEGQSSTTFVDTIWVD